MKRKLLFIALLFAGFSMSAQTFNITEHDGNGNETPISDGDIIGYSEFGYLGELKFYLNNTTGVSRDYRVAVVDIINADETNANFELCFGLCVSTISEGQQIPSSGLMSVTVPANDHQSSDFDHLMNKDAWASYTGNKDFYFEFFETDSSGSDLGGTRIGLTYRYNATLGIEDENNVEINSMTTLISDNMSVSLQEPAKLEVYDLLGKIVKTVSVVPGDNTISMSDLQSGTYIAMFSNKNNQRTLKKFETRNMYTR